MSGSTPPLEGATNLAVIVGTLSRAPEARVLPSGDELLALEVTVRPPTGSAASVPVAWFSPSPTARDWPAGHVVVVVGRVRRRFFRAGGATQSRVEVLATHVVPAARRAAARRALATALGDLERAIAA